MNIVLAHWSARWPVLIIYLAVALAHLAGLRRLLASSGASGQMTGTSGTRLAAGGYGGSDRGGLLREAAVFHAGLLVAVAALVSPLAYWSGIYLWVQAMQGLALSFIAPPLIVLGAPWLALGCAVRPARGGPAGAAAAPGEPAVRAGLAGRSRASRPWLAGRSGASRPWLAGMASPASRAWPVMATVLFNVTWLGWHLPYMSDLARTSSGAGIARTVTWLGTGMLFWLQLIGSRPLRPTAAPLRRVALVIGTIVAGTLLGMALAFGSSEIYPAYGGLAHHVLTMLDDQQLAGAVLWMGMLPPMIITAVALLQRWLSDEESQALSAGIEGLLRQRKSAWPSRPGFR